MNRFAALALVIVACSQLLYGQNPAATPPQDSVNAAAPRMIGHGAFPVKIIRSLDSSKLKDGDAIEAETLGAIQLRDGRLIPKHSKVIGYVKRSTARSRGDQQSELAIRFDKIKLDKADLRMLGIVQAVFPPPDEYDPRYVNGPIAKESGIGLTGADAKTGSNMDSGSSARAVMTTESTGVQGMKGLDLGRDGSLSSNGKSVKLNAEVRMIVRAAFLE